MAGRHPRAAAAAQPTAAQQSVKQTRFQGLWWGTERIWTDELVRLKIARCQFAPKGTDIIYPPAGPSATTLAELQKNPHAADTPMERLGASEKGLFMRLEGLFIVDVPAADGNGTTKECRASGMLYELVDHDWEEVVEANKEHDAIKTDGGKGKAREVTESEFEAMPREAEVDVSLESDHPPSQDPDAPPVMMQPSPLKPPPLPNPDPTVPIAETATNILEQTSPAAASGATEPRKTRSLSVQISHPVLSTPYPLPPPPNGFRFRPILKPGHEVVINLALISGRYYPGILYHPQMHDTVQQALSMANEEGGHFRHRHLWAMEGLLPGVHQSMEPRFWKASRVLMLQEADKVARERFRERWEVTKMERLHPARGKSDVNWNDIIGDNEASMEVDS